MATTRRKKSEIVNEQIEKWSEMEVSELMHQMHELEIQEETLGLEISTIRALKRALKEIIEERGVEGFFEGAFEI